VGTVTSLPKRNVGNELFAVRAELPNELVRGFATAKGEVLFRGVPRYDVLARAARMLDEPVVDAAGLAERITSLQGPGCRLITSPCWSVTPRGE
jgi:hypothetical protein